MEYFSKKSFILFLLLRFGQKLSFLKRDSTLTKVINNDWQGETWVPKEVTGRF